MKKILMCAVLILLFLSGCGKREAEATDAILPETNIPETIAVMEPADRAEYTIVLEDRSLRNENGDVLVESVYEKPVLQGTTTEIAAINEAIDADCNRFFAESGAVSDYEPETLEQMLRDMGMDYGDLMHNAYATVTNNKDHIFSVCISTDWFLGGVFHEDYYGMTFDLRTGERLALEQLSELPADELEARLKEITAQKLREAYGEGLFAEPEEILADYTLADLLFYVQEGEIILTFPTYTFTAGAAGATVIPTGLIAAGLTR